MKKISALELIIIVITISIIVTILFSFCLKEIYKNNLEISELKFNLSKKDSIIIYHDSLIISLYDILNYEIKHDNNDRDSEIVDLYNKIENINSYLEREPEFKK